MDAQWQIVDTSLTSILFGLLFGLPMKPFKLPKSKCWYGKIKTWDAKTSTFKWKKVSTQTTDYDQAKEVIKALGVASGSIAAMSGQTMSKSHFEALLRVMCKAAGVAFEDEKEWPSIQDTIDRYMRGKKAVVKTVTYRTYVTYWNTFTAWLGDDVSRPLDFLTPTRMNDFYHDCIDRMTVNSSNERIKLVSRLFAQAAKEIEYPTNPCLAVALGKIKKSEGLDRMPFTREELDALIGYLLSQKGRKHEWGLAAAISAMTGARLEDALRMDSSAITEGVLTYTQTKTGKTISVPLENPVWREAILEVAGAICPEIGAEFTRIGNARLSTEFTTLVSDAGIEQQFTTFKSGRKVARKTFHSLRHTLRTLIVSSGGSDAQADLILGHSSGQGKTYTHSEIDATRTTLGRVFD